MSKQNEILDNDMNELAEEASGLMAATADVVGDKVSAARERLHAALERGKVIANRVREQAVAGAQVTNEAIHAHPYRAIAVGVGLGALLGYLIARRCGGDNEES